MAKKTKKQIRKPRHGAKKKIARPTKPSRGKASPRKQKPVKKQGRTRTSLDVEILEVEIISGVEDDSFGGSESTVIDPLDEHFLPDYGGSE